VSGDGAGSSLRFAMNGLVAALSIHKAAYFILSLMVFVPLFGVPSAVVVSALDPSRNRVAGGACLVILVILGTGLGGVLAGGMAHLAVRDEGGRRGTVWSAFGFCARKFVSLFMGAVMFAAVVLAALVAVNGLVMLVSGTSRPGSILAALLLLPQFLVNVALALAAVVAILVPVAIATENVGASQAVGRVLDCVRHDTSRLFVHLAASTLIGDVIVIVLGKIVLVSLGLTLAANSPMLVRVLMSDFGSVSHVEEADVVLRLLAVGLIACVLLGYLSAYWVGSFAGYYRDALRRGFDARPRTRR
jgi:hypothetical protein